MVAKKIVVGLSCAVIISACGLIALLNQTKTTTFETKNENKVSTQTNTIKHKVVEEVKKYDLYSTSPYDIPLFSIIEISKLSEKTKKEVDSLLEQANGILFLKKAEDNKTVIILPNSISNNNTYSRHNTEMVEITSNPDGTFSKTIVPIGYSGYDGETTNAISPDSVRDDYWKFDKSTEPYRPLKHIVYDEKGKTKFTEYWDYSPKNPLKYIMKDAKGNIISLFKETIENDINLRQEHIFYEDDGSIAMSININYDGANITRFTYYNFYDLELSSTIITEYSDGLKIKESIYSKNYELTNTIEADYLDGERKSIKLLNKEAQEICKINS